MSHERNNQKNKTNYRNKLESHTDFRFALSSAKPRIKLLISQKPLHPSP